MNMVVSWSAKHREARDECRVEGHTMATATVGALRVDLGLDAAAFKDGLTGAQKEMKKASDRMKAVGANIGKAVVGIGVAFAGMATIAGGAIAGVGSALNTITKDLVELSAEAKTAGLSFESFQTWQYVAKQANVSIDALTDGMKEMQLRADEFATTGAGSAAEAFQRIGLSGAQLKDALKDPSAMFDDILARMQKLDTAAQIRVADEIFGGTGGEQFVRLLSLGGDQIAKMKQEFVNGGGLIPEAQVEKARAFQQAIDRLKASFSGMAINALMDSGVVEWFTTMIPQVMQFAQSAQGSVAPALAAMQKAAADIAPWLQKIGQAFIEGLGPMIPPLLKAVQDAFTALMPVATEVSKALIGGFGPILLTAFRAVAATVTSVFSIVGQALRVIGALLKGDWSGAWNAAGSLVMEVLRSIARIVESLFPGITEHVRKMVQGVTNWLSGKLFDVLEGVIRKVKFVSDAFFKLYDAVVGHSYVPDMVIEVGQWMARLQDVMVEPAQKAAAATAEAFEQARSRARAAISGLLTDEERAFLAFQEEQDAIRKGIEAGATDRNVGATMLARSQAAYDGRNLTVGPGVDLKPLNDASANALNETMRGIQQKIHDSRESFADAFEYGIDSALRGDWKGVLSAIVGDSFRDGLKDLGRMLFDALGKGNPGGGGINLSGIGSAIASFFSKGIPGFSSGVSNFGGGLAYVHGGEVLANLAPGTDVIPKREVGKLGRGGGGGVTHVVVSTNDDRFNAYVDDRAARPAAAAFSTARKTVPSDMARSDRYTLGRRR
jgi:hypothetical protein